MVKIVAHLGREQRLALAELLAVVHDQARLSEVVDEIAVFAFPEMPDLQVLQSKLGGTIRLSHISAELPAGAKADQLINALVSDLRSNPVRDFGLSSFGRIFSRHARDQLGLSVKKQLRRHGQASRFVSGSDAVLSTVLVTNQLIGQGREYLVVPAPTTTYLAQTVTIQHWQAWSDRDYNRPARDARRGMLPPKLARMMLNLAQVPDSGAIADPFCGVGTVLQEARLLGHTSLVGSDRDQAAIQATQTNLDWLENTFQLSPINLTLHRSIVEDLDPTSEPYPVDAIVSEADLGSPDLANFTSRSRAEQFLKMKPVYHHWLQKLYTLVKANGVLVLAYPRLRDPSVRLDLYIAAKTIGWQVENFFSSEVPIAGAEPWLLTYARSDQLIGRDILRLRRVR